MALVSNKIAVIGIFLIIILVPAFVDFKLHSIEIGKLFLFALLLCVVVFAWVIQIIKSKTPTISNFLPNYFVVAFLVAAVIATACSINPYLSVFGCYNRYEGLLTWIMYILLYFLACAFFNNAIQINLLLKVIVWSSVLPVFYGILQHCGVDPLRWSGAMSWRVHSTFGNPVFFGGYLCTIFPASLYLYLISKRAIPWGIFTIGIFTLLLFTQTRGAIVSWLISTLLFFILLGWRQLWQFKLRLLILVCCIFLVGLYLNLFLEKKLLDRFGRELVRGGSQEVELVGGAAGRLYIWTSCLKIIKDHPAFGIGPDTLEVVWPKYKSLEYVRLSGDYQRTNRAHNLFLDTYLSFGLLGFLSFFGFVGMIFFYFWRNLKQSRSGVLITLPLAIGILAYILQAQFSFSTIPTSIFFWIMAGALIGYLEDNKKKITQPLWLKLVFCSVCPTVVILIVCLYFYPYVINHRFQLAEVHRYSGYMRDAEKLYIEVLKADPYKNRYWNTLIDFYMDNNAPDKVIATIKQKASIFGYSDYIDYFNLAVACELKKDFTLAENYYKQAIKNSSYFGDAYHNLALLYWQHLNNKDRLAEDYFNRAVWINPQNPFYLHSLGSFYYNYGDWDKCIQLYEKITTVSPQYDEILTVRKTLADLYQKTGQAEKFITQCMEILNVKPDDLYALWGLTVVYYNDRSFEKAKIMCERLLGYYPNHLGAKRMLGLISNL